MGFIRELQKNYRLIPDGVLGKKTISKIKESLGKSSEEISFFLGQCSHESSNFTLLEENLNFSQKKLLTNFPKLFNINNVSEYVNNPVKIANRIYANFRGNGNESSGDGWKFRGRGLIKLRGKLDYLNFSHFINDEQILVTPELISTKYALESANHFFQINNVWQWCQIINDDNILKVSRIISFGTIKSKLMPHELKERTLLIHKIHTILK